jgi:hypothetical protein
VRWEKKRPNQLGGQKGARLLDDEQGLPKDVAAALKKARRMSANQAVDWADAALSSIGRNLTDHRHAPGVGDHLRAALLDAASVYACLTAAIESLPPTEVTTKVPRSEMGVTGIRQG